MQYVEEIGSRRMHGRSRNRLSSINFALAPWPILLMTAKASHMGCPLYPEEPTPSARSPTSEKCQKQK
jgi:hypothetical protein